MAVLGRVGEDGCSWKWKVESERIGRDVWESERIKQGLAKAGNIKRWIQNFDSSNAKKADFFRPAGRAKIFLAGHAHCSSTFFHQAAMALITQHKQPLNQKVSNP